MEIVYLDRKTGRVMDTTGRPLGTFKPLPKHKPGIKCGACQEIIPYIDWNMHRAVCKAIGMDSGIADWQGFLPIRNTKRRGMTNDELARRIASIL